MKFTRMESPYRDPAVRVADFREVALPPSEEATRREGVRCMDCGVPFCQGEESGCPLGNRIPEWNEMVADARWSEALKSLHATNNFPEFTSRLCPAPCESACVLGLHSEPVSIKNIERLIIDRGFDLGLIEPAARGPLTGLRVAVVGSGPAGLACAQELTRAGHEVTVFERAPRLGGLLRYGIPDFKMDKSLIDRRLEQLAREGIEFRPSTAVGKDIAFEDLRTAYDAVALATGAESPRDLRVPGRELGGIHLAMEFLVAQNRAVAGETPLPGELNAAGKSVIVLGGGDTGSDCVGTAHRQGAREVRQFELLARPPDLRDPSTPWPYWPLLLRTSHAHEEGGAREWSLSTKRFEGRDRVEGLVAERVSRDGGRFVPVPGSEIEFKAEMVILALGFTGPVGVAGVPGLTIELDERGFPVLDRRLMTSVRGVFAAGDVKRGASLIVWAIAEGRRMAQGIHDFLTPGS